MCKTEFENNHTDLDEVDLEEIARLVKEGYSSGHMNNEDKQTRIYWELKVNVWKQ